ncbi:MAG TPA: phosphotransferase [Micromonosporaceae bacterium]
MREHEEALVGHVTDGVVRIGDTVRRPAGPWTDAVDALLTHLRDVGFNGAPRPLGRDEQGRQVLEFVHGELCDHAGTFAPPELAAIGRLLRKFHEAVASFVPPASAVWNTVIPPDAEEVVCHNDPAPWNLIRSDRGWVLIDWDAAAPGSRLWDLAYAAQSMAGLNATRTPPESAERLRAFVNGYRADDAQRVELSAVLGRRARAMHTLLRTGAEENRQPWARIWVTDGAYWGDTADYLDANSAVWAAALR